MPMSGLLIARTKQVVEEFRADPTNADLAAKIWVMIGRGNAQAVLEEHLLEGPILNENYEFPHEQNNLIQIGLLTPCVIAGKTGSTVANYIGLAAYNAAVTLAQEKEA